MVATSVADGHRVAVDGYDADTGNGAAGEMRDVDSFRGGVVDDAGYSFGFAAAGAEYPADRPAEGMAGGCA